MTGDDSDKPAAERLKRSYEIVPPRVRQYLEAEIRHVLQTIKSGDSVLELGCGYGRVLARLKSKAGLLVGIDNSRASLSLARRTVGEAPNCHLVCTEAAQLALADNLFDAVVCLQNGISALHVDHRNLIAESLRVAKSGGILMFSTYSTKFWDQRLAWARLRSEAGLLGEIDWGKTGDGNIVCKDGTIGTAVSPEEFRELGIYFGITPRLVEVDESGLFCEFIVP